MWKNARTDVPTPVPPESRGRLDAERSGFHDASNIRTVFWNYGMVGDYPADPQNVDLSVFHSAEVPKGSGMNYSDGITPFVLAHITQDNGLPAYIMETGFRERQALSPNKNRIMRFEPRPGYFQPNPVLNPGRSPAISNDPRTWPDIWPDRLDDATDPGWTGSWNGYFGKQIVADQETYMVLDDDFYDAWSFTPDTRDPSRRGLGLRVEVRGFQWANPQARNVIFWHYDITNEGTVDYNDNIIFGLYMDSGVGGSALSCDGIFESDDDNSFFDREFDEDVINLVYTWDNFGHGRDLTSSCARTGYLGYAYLETPGNALDLIDNDEDGITNELRNSGPGQLLQGQPAIDAYLAANYDLTRFVVEFGPLADRPAYRAGIWWTGDEDLDWDAEVHDVGADGLGKTGDIGEGDGIPTDGEPSFDRTDLNESDQIGLTGFKINRIRPGQGNPDQTTDGIVFFTDNSNWPQRLYEKFTDPDPAVRFDPPLASNYNIGFLFASGPFTLKAGQRERFSLALAYGADLNELRRTVRTVQQIYDANYRFAVPPPAPIVSAEAGDGFVRLNWSDISERASDPVTGQLDFEGYRIYRSTDPDFRDVKTISNATGTDTFGNGKPIAQFDLIDGISGFSEQVEEGVTYYLGSETGITHTWTDFSAVNGQLYYYAVTAYDFGSSSPRNPFFPSENAISVSRTARGGVVLPAHIVSVRPNVRAAGYVPAGVEAAAHIQGPGTGSAAVEVVNSNLVPDSDQFEIRFLSHPDSVHAESYALVNVTTNETFFDTGMDFDGKGIGPTGSGLLPIVLTGPTVQVDPANSGFLAGSTTDAQINVIYVTDFLGINVLRPGFPDNLRVEFSDTIVDTSTFMPFFPARPVKFRIFAETPGGDLQLDFRYREADADSMFNKSTETLDVITYHTSTGAAPQPTWRLSLAANPTNPPASGDVYRASFLRPLSRNDVFAFTSHGESIDPETAGDQFRPYVVPNPYVASASFEPERFAVSGRGERRIEFRGLPARCTIRIYTVRGDLVQTLFHEGSMEGFVAWNLRTRDNLDLAPGLYLFHVDGGDLGTNIGKFAVVK
jgi:hypothetical protein